MNRSPSSIHRRFAPLAIVWLAVLLIAKPSDGDDQPKTTLRRFALIAGANDGGTKRVRLRFATEDAKSVLRVLRDLGGILAGDTILLTDPDPEDLTNGLESMRRKLETAAGKGERLELLFYFSGHSDEQGLLLGGERVTYNRIRAIISSLPADVKVAIVDSCASGAMTREKGGVRRPPFMIDSSTDVKGFAILTSSSADEAAQESDKVGGSFFTHYLVSGLRGAADTTRDDRVSLNEAYAYAFHETLARTESTRAGPQHPAYDFQLSGSGDLVLTDLRETSALLEIDATLSGRLFIRDAAGNLVAEVNKPAGRPMSLGLEPGEYQVSLQAADGWHTGRVRLEDGKKAPLALSSLKRTAGEATTVRGEASVDLEPVRHRPVSMGIFPGVSTDGGIEGRVRNNFSLNLIGWGDHLTGFELSSIGAIRSGTVKGLQVSGVFGFTKENSSGAMVDGVVGIVNGASHGLRIGGVGDISRKDSFGLHLGGVVQWAGGEAVGLHIGGVTSVSGGDATGMRVGGVTDLIRGSGTGLIIGGVTSVVTEDMVGLQLGGVADVVRKKATGLQLGGVVATSGSARGLQLGGVAAIAHEELTGAQIGGIVNVCGTCRGVQLGLVNVATKSMRGAQIGLVNYAADGRLAFTYWGSETAITNIGMKLGSKHMHGLVGYSLDPLGERWSGYFFGLGGHAELAPALWLEVDALAFAMHPADDWEEDETDLLAKLRGVIGWRCLDQMSIYAGITLNNLISERRDHVGFDWSMRSRDVGDLHYRLSLGFLLGVQWEPKWGGLNRNR